MRYYFGYSPSATKQFYVDTVGGTGGTAQFTEYRLGSVTIADGNFSLYAQDADLLSGSYRFFGWAWIRLVPHVDAPPTTTHYITALHDAGGSVSTGSMRLAGVTLPAAVQAVAVTGDQPFVATTTYGQGRGVQWGSYDWMSHSVLGPVHGLDDLVWRSMVWAARKPFVMQVLPPIVTMRADDGKGPFAWIHTANDFGFKPWVGLFFEQVSETNAADLSGLTKAGLATASIHAFSDEGSTGRSFYFDRANGTSYSDSVVAANFSQGSQWHQAHDIPIARFVVPHYYEFGTNVFDGLRAWGVEFVGTHMTPGTRYGSQWLRNGPYRRYEGGLSNSTVPVYYADPLVVPGRPDLGSLFFNCVTEIRDENGYEWSPNNDVAATIGHGVRQLERAFASRVLATLFTHEYYIRGISDSNWRAIMQGVSVGIADYRPLSMTMDGACHYVRALSLSSISGATFDTETGVATTTLIGSADVPTSFSVFTATGDHIDENRVDVPAFSGSTEVVTSLGTSGDADPPIITNVTVSEIDAASATVSWTSDEGATSQVEYGTTGAYGLSTSLDQSLATSHRQVISGLAPSTEYHYRVASRDAAGNIAYSPDATFTTSAPQTVPGLTIDDVTATEGNTGTSNAVFTVSLSAASGLPVSVAYATANGTAVAGSDYTARSGTLTFDAGVITQTVSVPVTGDTLVEPNETFTVGLSGAVNATIADGQATGTIVDDDAAPPVSVTVNCWDDAHQSPVLATTTSTSAINLSDGRWTEFLYTAGRPFPTVLAGANEYERYALPAMRFFTSGLANGTYDVYANLYTQRTGRNMRYYWGYSASATKLYSIDTVGGSGGATEHTEYRLGSVTVSDGTFSLYAQDADLLSGSYSVFGWAWIRLVPTGV